MQRVVILFLIYLLLLTAISWVPAPYRLKERFSTGSGFQMKSISPSPAVQQATAALDPCLIYNTSYECDTEAFNTCKFENGACMSYSPTALDCVMSDWDSWMIYPPDPCQYRVRAVIRNAKSGGRQCVSMVNKKCPT